MLKQINMPVYENLNSLLSDFLDKLSIAKKSRLKTTTDSFINSYVRENTFEIDNHNGLLKDLDKIKLRSKNMDEYTLEDIKNDKMLIENIVNSVKHNNYDFIAIYRFRRRK